MKRLFVLLLAALVVAPASAATPQGVPGHEEKMHTLLPFHFDGGEKCGRFIARTPSGRVVIVYRDDGVLDDQKVGWLHLWPSEISTVADTSLRWPKIRIRDKSGAMEVTFFASPREVEEAQPCLPPPKTT